MMRPRHRVSAGRRMGFTLVELLLVTAVLGLVVTAIGACLGGGIRAWEAARTFNTVESQALFGLRILRRDVMNAIPFYAVPFTGEPQEMSFLIRRPPADRDDTGLATVRYAFDPYEGTLTRMVWPFPGAAPGGDTVGEQLVSSVSWLAFSFGSESAPGQRLPEWADPTNHPLAVTVTMDLSVGDEKLTLADSFIKAVPCAPLGEDDDDE